MTLPMPSTAVAARIVPHGSATRLRLATADDALFIRELFHASRADVFLAAGLPQATLDMLLLHIPMVKPLQQEPRTASV